MILYRNYETPEKGWAVVWRGNTRESVRVKAAAIALLAAGVVLTPAKAMAPPAAGEEGHAPKRLVVLEVDVAEEETVVLTTRTGDTAVVSDHVRGYSLGLVPEFWEGDPFHPQVRVFALIGRPHAAKRGELLEVLDPAGGAAATTIEGVYLRVRTELLDESSTPRMGCAVTCGPFFASGLAVKAACGRCSDDR